MGIQGIIPADYQEGNDVVWRRHFDHAGVSIRSFAYLCGLSAHRVAKYFYRQRPVPPYVVHLAKYALIRMGKPVELDVVDRSKMQRRRKLKRAKAKKR